MRQHVQSLLYRSQFGDTNIQRTPIQCLKKGLYKSHTLAITAQQSSLLRELRRWQLWLCQIYWEPSYPCISVASKSVAIFFNLLIAFVRLTQIHWMIDVAYDERIEDLEKARNESSDKRNMWSGWAHAHVLCLTFVKMNWQVSADSYRPNSLFAISYVYLTSVS